MTQSSSLYASLSYDSSQCLFAKVVVRSGVESCYMELERPLLVDSSGCLFHNMEVHTGHRICWSERPFGGIAMGSACEFGKMHIVFITNNS